MNESRLWTFFLLLIVSIGIVLCGFNASTYNKIANEKVEVGGVSSGEARTLMAFNIIILIFICPLWIWYVYKLIYGNSSKSFKEVRGAAASSFGTAMKWVYDRNGNPRPVPAVNPNYGTELELGQISRADRFVAQSGLAESDF
jgi:hypothetical protein